MKISTEKLELRELTSYFGYGVGQYTSVSFFAMYILYFYTDVLGISAVSASTIFLIARVWDAVNDPIAAGLMDSVNLKGGKFRPYMLFTPFLIALTTVLSFWAADMPYMQKVLYAGVTYILWGTLYTLSDIPFWAIASSMSDNAQQRTRAVTFGALGASTGNNMSHILVPILTGLLAGKADDERFLYMAIIMMAGALVLMINGYFNVKERVKPAVEKIYIKDLIQSIKVNRPLQMLFIMNLGTISFAMCGALYIYFFTNNLGNANLMAALGSAGIFFSVLALITPKLTARFRKRDLMIFFSVAEFIARALTLTVGYDNPTLIVTLMVIHIPLGIFNSPLENAMVMETIEYSELKTGKRCAATTFAGMRFITKMSVALGTFLGGLWLIWIGYEAGTELSKTTLDGIFYGALATPMIGILLRIFIMYHYDFTEDKHREVCEQLHARNKNSRHEEGEMEGEPVMA